MSLDKFLLDLLEDPTDHGPLIYVEADEVLYNPRLRKAYAVRDSIPVLLPNESIDATETQHAAWTAAHSE